MNGREVDIEKMRKDNLLFMASLLGPGPPCKLLAEEDGLTHENILKDQDMLVSLAIQRGERGFVESGEDYEIWHHMQNKAHVKRKCLGIELEGDYGATLDNILKDQDAISKEIKYRLAARRWALLKTVVKSWFLKLWE